MTKRLWAAIIGACAVVGALCIWFGFIRSPEQRPGGGDQVPSLSRWYGLDEAAQAAMSAGRSEKARELACESLRGANGRERDWNYGNAIHNANAVLGQVALGAGDIETAKTHLIAAGKTPGSPQLNSFGPDLTLAQALLDRGEAQTT